MSTAPYSADEMMSVVAARALRDRAVCFVGIGIPSTAANLARRLHAPDAVLIYESGAIGARPTRLPLSIGDEELADTAQALVSVPEIFAYWLQAGRIDVGLLGAAQIDRYGNINTTVIGDYRRPRTRLPGAGGAPEIACSAREVFVVLRHTPRAFVEQVDFVTSVGHRSRGATRKQLGLPGRGPTLVITDLCLLRPDQSGELRLSETYPGVNVETIRARTGWKLELDESLAEASPPTVDELAALRTLEAA